MNAITIVDAPAPETIPASSDAFLDGLPGPIIFRVPGDDRTRVRVISGTLHGNEPSGLRAIHRVLQEGLRPTTDVLFFLGAIDAAKRGPRFSHRFLPGRRDLNRCFKGPFDDEDGVLARAALDALTARPIELAVDLHNNTGKNPSYAICLGLDGPELAVAAHFTDRIMRSDLRMGTLTETLRAFGVSITIECGQAHDPAADAVAYEGLRRLLQKDRVDPVVVSPVPLEIFIDPVRVELLRGMTLAFDHVPHAECDVTLDPDIDRHNFETMPAGTRMGTVAKDAGWPLVAKDEAGGEHSRDMFTIDDDGTLRAAVSFVPVMMTTHVQIARDDCLFYAVHRRQ